MLKLRAQKCILTMEVAAVDLSVRTINTSRTREMDFMWLVPHSRSAPQLQVTYIFTETHTNEDRNTECLAVFFLK